MWRKRRAEGKKEEERGIPFPMIAKPISTDQRLYRLRLRLRLKCISEL